MHITLCTLYTLGATFLLPSVRPFILALHNPEALHPVLNIPDGQSNLLNTCGPEDFAAEFCLITATKDDYILIVNGAAGQTVM